MANIPVFSDFLDMILPPRCLVTGVEVDGPGMMSPSVWRQLTFISHPYCACCGLPFALDLSADGITPGAEHLRCVPCLDDPPPFAHARSVLRYDDVSRDVILAFKHGDRTEAVRTFAPWMARAGAELLREADGLVPVPLHRWRLLRRRYNQAALMAHALSRLCLKPVYPDALLRTRATPPQGHLTPRERDENVRGVFAPSARREGTIAGKRLVLIDDVYTSGATVKACTRALLKAGARAVDVLTLARVVRES